MRKAMNTYIEMKLLASSGVVGVRATGTPVRKQIEQALNLGAEVVLDFAEVEATQSFVDEVVGLIVLERGPQVLGSLVFRNCSEDVKTIVQFVASDRAEQHEQRFALAA